MNKVELIQYVGDKNLNSIVSPKIDGKCLMLLKAHILEETNNSEDTANHIFSNGYQILPYLVDPKSLNKAQRKILCLGKVQSGKTSFFISSIALAFDNGYNLAYVIGGTKTKLKKQNFERLTSEFANNPTIKVIDITGKITEEPQEFLDQGYKVILVALKNASENANLGSVEKYSEKFSHIPSIIVDDEGDECSPGAPKLKIKKSNVGIIHDYIARIISNIRICTFLSVTATPQANLLLSTIDELSPDYCVLVTPGEGYTGGNAFHDTYNNVHVVEINDSDKFNSMIPETFKNALYYFIFCLLVQNYRGDNKRYSMLIHPSSLTRIQSMVTEKVKDSLFIVFQTLREPSNIGYDEMYEKIFDSGKDIIDENISFSTFKKNTQCFLQDVLSQMSIYEYNVSDNGKKDIELEYEDTSKYRIYVGGNMLGRGLTIKNLIVTYIYRDAKITQIDTLYQRARWFGYKKSYFDLCRVYITKDLKEKFIRTVENENDMWTSLKAFLLTKTNIKEFPRIFTLNDDRLKLTRSSVSKTVSIERIAPGYEYDKSIWLTGKEKNENKLLYKRFYDKYNKYGEDRQYGTSEYQHHFIIELKYTEFYEEFILKYNFPRGSRLGPKTFEKIRNQIVNGEYEDKIVVALMRYKTGEYRSSIFNDKAIKELPQSYDNGTNYPGDKSLPDLEKVLHVQLHAVYTDKNNTDDIIPVIALNNPITAFNIRYVTGDNDYETV